MCSLPLHSDSGGLCHNVNFRDFSGTFFLRSVPQQKQRTHRSLEAYCATLWWRWREIWLVFSFFQVMEQRWNEIDRGKSKYSGRKPVPVSLCPPQIPHGLTRDRTRPCAVRIRRLTAWAMARPFLSDFVMWVKFGRDLGLLISIYLYSFNRFLDALIN
jgi:hypothetical protein